jgi:hypothetical protein
LARKCSSTKRRIAEDKLPPSRPLSISATRPDSEHLRIRAIFPQISPKDYFQGDATPVPTNNEATFWILDFIVAFRPTNQDQGKFLSSDAPIVEFLLSPSKMFLPGGCAAATRYPFPNPVSAGKADNQS